MMITRRAIAYLITLVSLLRVISGVSAQGETASETPIATGRIAYIGADFNVYSVDADGNNSIQLTSDAGINDDKLKFYQWPTWSTDGRLAYFGGELERSGASRTEVLISADGLQDGASASVFEDDSFTYAAWSPQNCDADATCRDLAVLLTRPSANGFVVELVRDLVGEDTHTLTDKGSPFYFSWSSSGTQMFWHRNNAMLEEYTVSGEDPISSVTGTPGLFNAPAWSPVDDRLLFAESDGSSVSNALITVSGENNVRLVEGLQGPTAFSWSPDGSKIAYANLQGPLIVIDSVSGEELTRSVVGGVFSFFWSPDSQRIAYITLAQSSDSFSAQADTGAHLASMIQDSTGIAWSVLDVVSEQTSRYGAFTPTRDEAYLLTYFDQFSQSHRVWSPDSRSIVYGEIIADQRSVVSVLDTSGSVTVPLIIADGSVGIWSFQ